MKAAPPIKYLEILPDLILKIKFEGMADRYVDLNSFPLLGIAKKLKEPKFLAEFKIVDGVPEWDGQCLLGPEDLLAHSSEIKPLSATGSFSSKIESFYRD